MADLDTGVFIIPGKTVKNGDGKLWPQQAAWLRAAFAQASQRRVERVFWLFLNDTPSLDYFGAMGLSGSGGDTTPEWIAFRSFPHP